MAISHHHPTSRDHRPFRPLRRHRKGASITVICAPTKRAHWSLNDHTVIRRDKIKALCAHLRRRFVPGDIARLRFGHFISVGTRLIDTEGGASAQQNILQKTTPARAWRFGRPCRDTILAAIWPMRDALSIASYVYLGLFQSVDTKPFHRRFGDELGFIVIRRHYSLPPAYNPVMRLISRNGTAN